MRFYRKKENRLYVLGNINPTGIQIRKARLGSWRVGFATRREQISKLDSEIGASNVGYFPYLEHYKVGDLARNNRERFL